MQIEFNNVDSIFEGLSKLGCKQSRSRSKAASIPGQDCQMMVANNPDRIMTGDGDSQESKSAAQAPEYYVEPCTVIDQLGKIINKGKESCTTTILGGKATSIPVPARENKVKTIAEVLFSNSKF